ncbi:unnamed protein product [[Candida] boidinii]|nr:unnamed protein product [[Candida] boidinii]
MLKLIPLLDSNLDDQVIGISLDNGYFYIYSPTKNEIIHKILNPNNIAISHLQYNPFNDYVYSVDFQGSISEWKPSDWSLRKSIKSDSVDSSIRKIEGITYERTPYILAISQSIYLIDPENPNDLSINLPGHITQINSVVPIIKNSSILTSAVGDRFINCISLIKRATTNVFVTESPVVSIAYFENEFNMELLAAVTENGVIEIFNNPFANNEDSNDVDNNEVDTNSNGKSPLKKKSVLNRRRRSAAVVKSKPSDLIISINRPKDSNPTNEKLTIQNVTITSKYLKFSWLEDSSISFFDNIEWWKLNENSEKYYNLNENIDLIKVKPNLKTTQHSLFGHDRASAKHYNEANAIISSGDQIGDVNKDTDEEDEDDEDEELTLAEKLELANSSTTNNTQNNNTQNNNTNNNKNNNNNSNAQTVNKQKKSVSSGTLTVVLSQALKANDHSLLETVLNNKDESIIRNTISRLQSSYIIILLSRLAERIARNGNRQLNLTHWIKWVLIFHGGYLLNYPNTSSDLSILSSTLRRKADSLDRMLELKGKLNLLTDKIELKRDMMSWENEGSGEDEDEDEVNVEYIEELDDAGLLDSDSDDDEDEDLDEIDDDDADDDEGVYEGEEGMEIDEDAEANYSDVEDESIKTKIVDDIDSDDEYETKLLKKIKNLKNKKSKN